MKNLSPIFLLFVAGLAWGGVVPDAKSLDEWIRDLDSQDAATCVRAAEAIGRLGPKAKAAVPALRKALTARKGQLQFAAAEALWKVDREAFTQVLKGPKESHERFALVISLTRIGPAAKELTPVVLEMAGDQREPQREHALLALGYIGAEPALAVPVLTAALRDGQYAQMLAAQALGQFGKKAKDALPALHRAMQNRDPQVRVDAARAVWKIEPEPLKIVPVLAAALEANNEDGSVTAARQRAVRGLGDIGPDAKEAFPALQKLWKGENSQFLKNEIATAMKAIDAKAAKEAGVQ